eukprot:scaffold10768_cov24-Cyclotella_meneghiniana.AAC.3
MSCCDLYQSVMSSGTSTLPNKSLCHISGNSSLTLKYKNLPDFQLDPANEPPKYRHMPPSSVDCWVYYLYHYHAKHQRGCSLQEEGWGQWRHSAAAFAVSKACNTLLVVPAAVSVDATVVVRDDARLVLATAGVRHGSSQNFSARGLSWKWT